MPACTALIAIKNKVLLGLIVFFLTLWIAQGHA
jgi:hypothetical protein